MPRHAGASPSCSQRLRLRGISTPDAGNSYLPEFAQDYNARFSREPQSPHDAHRLVRGGEDLDQIFTWQEERKLSKNLTVHYYDGLGRLTGVDRDPAGSDPCTGVADESFGHDANGNVNAKNGTSLNFGAAPHQATSFGAYTSILYDANGSRTYKDKGGGTGDDFVYDARGLLTQVKRWTGGALSSSQTNVYDYAGSRVVRAPSATAGGSTIRTYNRFADASSGNLTRFYYLGDRLVATQSVSAPTLSDVDPELLLPAAPVPLPALVIYPAAALVLLLVFLPLGGQRRLGVRVSFARSASVSLVFLVASVPVVLVSGCVSAPTVRWLHVDHLSSTQVVTDWHGDIYRQMRYTAYGEIRGRFGPAGLSTGYSEDARFEFTGYETDFAGLDYAEARFFDPELAQFASHDPAGQYPSPYAYGPGDPINGADPTGTMYEETGTTTSTTTSVNVVALIVNSIRAGTLVSNGAVSTGSSMMRGPLYSGDGQVQTIYSEQVGGYIQVYAQNIGASGSNSEIVPLAYGADPANASSSETVSGSDSASSRRGTQYADSGDSATEATSSSPEQLESNFADRLKIALGVENSRGMVEMHPEEPRGTALMREPNGRLGNPTPPESRTLLRGQIFAGSEFGGWKRATGAAAIAGSWHPWARSEAVLRQGAVFNAVSQSLGGIPVYVLAPRDRQIHVFQYGRAARPMGR